MTPPIAILTDFGLQDTYVGVMKGVIAGIAPSVPVLDLSHGVPPQQVLVGALWLDGAISYFPAGTTFLCVVDPGVGSDRKVLAARLGRWTVVAPDNGLVSVAARRHGLGECVSVEAPEYRLPSPSSTFHGRDIMAPAAAHLALGLAIARLGPPLRHPVELALPVPVQRGRTLEGAVLYLDHFGNAVTSIPGRECPAGSRVRVEGWTLPLSRTYSQVEPGRPLALVGSTGYLEISVNGGSAAESMGLGPGTAVSVERPPGDGP